VRDYELVLIISPEVADEEVTTIVEKVSQFIAEKGGAVAGVDYWGRRKLAYPIRQFLEGSYVLTQFRIEPQHAAELEASLKISDDIIRHLLVRVGD